MSQARLESAGGTPQGAVARALEVNRLLQTLNDARRRGAAQDPLVHRTALAKATELAGLFARLRKKRTPTKR